MTTLQQSMVMNQSSGEMEELLPLVKQLTDPDQVRRFFISIYSFLTN